MNLKIPAWATIIYAALTTIYLAMVYINQNTLSPFRKDSKNLVFGFILEFP
jgi:hypothetical protein